MVFTTRRHEPPAMTLEGAMGANSRLDDAQGMPADAPEVLCAGGDGRLLFSSGNLVCSLTRWGAEPEPWRSFDAPVTALSSSAGGLVAVGLAGGRLAVFDRAGQPCEGWSALPDLMSLTDCVFLAEDVIVVVDNGYAAQDNFLATAAWGEASRGRVVTIDRNGGSQPAPGDFHCPMGICLDRGGELIVSLFERGSVVDMSGRARRSGYPGYLGRIRPTGTGFVMACLSRRDPLIEFLKTEPDFIEEMKARIEPQHWIAPRLSPEFSHDYPIVLGSTRLFGEVKPWAPSFSYGLVIEMDAHLMPVGSAHSRANGRRHAVSDVCIWNGDLLAVSKASGEILNLGSGSASA